MAKTSFTFKLTEIQQQRLLEELKSDLYSIHSVPHSKCAVKTANCNITLYNSGKCLIQGKGAEDWVLFKLEPEIMEQALVGYEAVITPAFTSPHMGIDESGKGDLFGPLVIAAVYVDPEISDLLLKEGVRDSKAIKSDAKILRMASSIRQMTKGQFSVISIGPSAYNRLYKSLGNLNKMLAWGHARAIENVLEKVPDCPRAVADQFGPKHQIESALLKKGQKIELEQRPRAEDDPAVAAASILAREGFVKSLITMGRQMDVEIPKGVSSKVKAAASQLISTRGPEILEQCCKLHFKTAEELLQLQGYSRSDAHPDY